MKVSELRERSVENLGSELIKAREEQFRLRMQMATGQLGQTHLIKTLRRDIARIKTVLTEKAGN